MEDSAGESNFVSSVQTKRAIFLLFQSLLNRSPDPQGLSGGLYKIRELGFDKGLKAIAKGLVGSDEYKWINRDLLSYSDILSGNDGRLIDGKAVDHIISLGSNCQASSILKKYGLKPQSFPFDWLFNSPLAVLHCINDDFKKFLDKSFYRSLEPYEGGDRADHLFYKDAYGVDSFFAHRDPTNLDDYQFFVRCIDRFRETIKSSRAKILVIISGNHHDLVNSFDEIHEWTAQLSCANVLAIQLRDPVDGRCLRKVRSESHGDLYEFSPNSAEAGLGFPDLLDDLTVLKLICEYKIASSAKSVMRSVG